jgi:DNA polymerase delta subunit 4
MPPAARRKSARNSANAQHTLSFHSKPTKVTKPTTTVPLSKNSAKLEPALVDAITEDAPTSEIALRPQIKIQLAKAKDAIELRAEKITDAQIKKYWRKEEEVRQTPRGMAHRRLAMPFNADTDPSLLWR